MVSLLSIIRIRFAVVKIRRRILNARFNQTRERRARVMTDLCSGFEAQNYLKDRCRKCFRPKDTHEDVSIPTTKKERRKSWKERINDNGGPEEISVSDDLDILSVSSYLSATSKGLSSMKSAESVNDTKSMVTAMSGSIEEEQRAMTPTEDDQSMLLSMKDEIARLRAENRELKDQREHKAIRQSVRPKDNSEQSLIQMLEDRINEAENSIQDYRDENTVLKCELRELQETTYASSDEKLKEKLKTTESLCDELMEENEMLKAETKDLQHEIEEMQDQYREEEIEEFRELQRELEQNAKNCRVLQFKLRKAERMKEAADTEKYQMQTKLNDILASTSDGVSVSLRSDSAKVRELESELRIAKEVSVRLHNELEQTEEKRYKLEDEVFYLKEKVRELQTQSKWREARNRTDTAVKRLSAELSTPMPTLPEGEISKDLRDALEREIDLREQLRFAEEDLKRTQTRLQEMESENESLLKKLSKSAKLRPPMVRSASEGNAHLQLELAEHEVEHLSTKVERLEKTNDHLTKKIAELETDSTRKNGIEARLCGGEFKMTPEVERDMSKMLATISDLERKNKEINAQLKQHENKNSSSNTNAVSPEVRVEQEKRRVVESELNELKQILVKTDNQKLVTLATKIEQLNSQLSMANDRCNNLHKRLAKEGDSAKYMDELKSKIETLERQLSEKKAATTIQELQGQVPTTDEIEQVCEVLASIESQTGRLCKQIEKIDQAQKDERRRSLSKDSGATIIAELANIMQEMKNVHGLMDGIKSSNPSMIRLSPMREFAAQPRAECKKCKENDKFIEEQQNEIVFYKKKNKDLTNQVLQTEDRWTIEIEKQRQIFENEIKNLGIRLSDSKRQIEEYQQLVESKSSTLIERTRALEEIEERAGKLERELDEQRKEKTDLDTERKSVREFEIKYNKLESIFELEREKMNSERGRNKSEIVALKKIAEDAEELLKQSTNDLRKKELAWKSEKASLDRELNSLKKQLAACKNGEGSEHDERASSHDSSDPAEAMKVSRTESDKIHVIDLKKQIALIEKKYCDSQAKLEDVKISNAELRDELKRTKEAWSKEKESFQHKTRQTEKIRSVEMDAMQQKFSSRMRIMEDTNKSLHSQLVLARRERDSHKESLNSYEIKMIEERKNIEKKTKEHAEAVEKAKSQQLKLNDLETELERVNTDLRLTKEARKADQILWNMDRARGRNEKISEEDKKNVENVQQQYKECEKFYAKEVDRLNERIKEITDDAQQQKNASNKTMRELRETIRMLEIDQRNLSQNRDNQSAAREVLEAETERLRQIVHMIELHKLTRKYRLSSIIDQLQYVTDPLRRSGKIELDHPDGIRYIINQLIAIRDEDASGQLNGEERCPSAQPSMTERNGYAPSLSECGDGTYDNISQSSFSIRSATSMPVRSTVSTESSTGFDRYGRIQGKRSPYPDPPPSFMINLFDADVDKSVEYDKEGRLHFVPKGMRRTASFDRKSDMEDEANHSRPGSAGTNILYRVRREELARGGQPSVKLMAKAFEAIDEPKADKRGFFGIRKSRSVETTQDRNKKKTHEDACSSALKHSLNQVDEGVTSAYATLPRGGRNPFKHMGSKLVERVRRSLSRSSRQGSEVEEPATEPVKKEKGSSSPKKTKKKSAESKARKSAANGH